MPLKIFIDIGAYTGDTLDLALKYDYDIIHCFEPVPIHYEALIQKVSEMIYGPIIIIHPYGLLDIPRITEIYAAGSDGASIYQSKKQFSHQNNTVKCSFRDAETIFKEFYNADCLDVKINCEGAEWPIIERLSTSDRLNQINDLCIHYDVLKVPGMEDKMNVMEQLMDDCFEGRRLTVGRNKQIHSDYPGADLSQGKNWVANWLEYINQE